MMNKAEKKLKEMEVIKDVYTYISGKIESLEYDLNYWRNRKVNELEENPEANTEYYDMNIEEIVFKIEKHETLAEKIYKLM